MPIKDLNKEVLEREYKKAKKEGNRRLAYLLSERLREKKRLDRFESKLYELERELKELKEEVKEEDET